MKKVLSSLALSSLFLLAACGKDTGDASSRAQEHFDAHEYTAARLMATNALKESPGDPAMLELLARTQLHLLDGTGALATLDKVAQAGGTLQNDPLFRAEALVRDGQFEAALDQLKGNPTAEAARIRALAHASLDQFDEARAALQSGLGGEGDKGALYADYALFMLGDGNLADAAHYAALAQTTAPEALGSLDAAGQVAAARGEYDVSLARFEEAEQLYPESRAAVIGRIRALGALGRIEEAAPLIESGYARTSGDWDYTFLMARLEVERGNWSEARRIMQPIERDLWNFPDGQMLYARILLEDGQSELAHAMLTRLNRKFPQHGPSAALLAEVRLERGDRAGALRVLEPVASLPDAPSWVTEMVAGTKGTSQP